jgi:hypothetical protein
MATYTYDVVKSGFNKQIRIFKDGTLIYTGSPSSTAPTEGPNSLLSEAKAALINKENPPGVNSISEWIINPQPGSTSSSTPVQTPQQVEDQRTQEAAQRSSSQEKITDVDATSIQNATTGDQKPKGSARLSITITNLGKKIYTLLLPIAVGIAIELGVQLAQSELDKIKQKILPKDGCPTNDNIKKILDQRNALVNQLNNISKQLNILTKAVTGLSTFLSVSEVVITAIQTTKTTISLAAKFIPAPPGIPGVITSSLSDLEDIIMKLLFNKQGEPRLPKIVGIIASSALAISIINGYIQLIVFVLQAIDIKLKQCNPNLTLIPIDTDLTRIAILQTQSEQTQNQVTYQGFIIEIETVPYTPTVNRYKAVGKNQSGIILIETELSFTSEPQLLTNELKLIIDRDNLKAY